MESIIIRRIGLGVLLSSLLLTAKKKSLHGASQDSNPVTPTLKQSGALTTAELRLSSIISENKLIFCLVQEEEEGEKRQGESVIKMREAIHMRH